MVNGQNPVKLPLQEDDSAPNRDFMVTISARMGIQTHDLPNWYLLALGVSLHATLSHLSNRLASLKLEATNL